MRGPVRELTAGVTKDIAEWFGAPYSAGLQLLRIYRIPFAQPNQEVWMGGEEGVRLIA